MGLLREKLNSSRIIHDTNFRDFEELHKAANGEKLVRLGDFLLCDRASNMRCQSELGNTSHDTFESSERYYFCDLPKN